MCEAVAIYELSYPSVPRFAMNAGRQHLTLAVSRRATQDSRMRTSDHWRGRLQCFVEHSALWADYAS